MAHAIHCYLAASVQHDPPAVLGIDNVFLLLLAEVKKALQDGETHDNAAGLVAAESVCRQIKSENRSRGVRRWLRNNEWMLIEIAETMAQVLAKPGSSLQAIPLRPFYGHVRHHKIGEPWEPDVLGDWRLEFILEPLPKWYLVRLLRPPFRISSRIDKLAHTCLSRAHN